ncbi:30S ribosomal protein S8 chloroplastic, partial [Bienertia sinuspersici]
MKGRDTVADIIASDMNRKGMLRIVSTDITKNNVKILLQEGFIKNARKHQEGNKYFLVLTLQHKINKKGHYRNTFYLERNSRWNGKCNPFYLARYNDGSGGSTRRNWRRNFMIYM